MRVILLTGQARAGKTTLANAIATAALDLGYNPVVCRFADPIKKAADALGLDKAVRPRLYRLFCQYSGATLRNPDTAPEEGSGPDFFVNRMEEHLQDLAAQEQERLSDDTNPFYETLAIIDDGRYLNEVMVGTSWEAFVIHVHRPDLPEPDADWRMHESEAMAREWDAEYRQHQDVECADMIWLNPSSDWHKWETPDGPEKIKLFVERFILDRMEKS